MKSCNDENLTLTNNDLHLLQQSKREHVENRAINQIETEYARSDIKNCDYPENKIDLQLLDEVNEETEAKHHIHAKIQQIQASDV